MIDVYGIELYIYNGNNDVMSVIDIEGCKMMVIYDGVDVVLEIFVIEF